MGRNLGRSSPVPQQYCCSIQLYLECDAAKRASTAFAIAPLTDQQSNSRKMRKLHCLARGISRRSNRLECLPYSAAAVQSINDQCTARPSSSVVSGTRSCSKQTPDSNMWSLTVGQCSFTVVGANHTGQITTNRGRVPRRTIVAPSRCDLGLQDLSPFRQSRPSAYQPAERGQNGSRHGSRPRACVGKGCS